MPFPLNHLTLTLLKVVLVLSIVLLYFKWAYHKEQSFASNDFIFLKILFQFKNPSYKELIWCTNNLNAHIRTFCKRWSFIWRCFFPVSILRNIHTGRHLIWSDLLVFTGFLGKYFLNHSWKSAEAEAALQRCF